MDFWSNKGRPTLLAALEAVCDGVGEGLAAEIQKRDEDRHASLLEEIRRLRSVAARAEQLEKENRSLAHELERLRRSQAVRDAQPPKHSPAASESAKERIPGGGRPALAEISANTKMSAAVHAASAKPTPGETANLEEEYSRLAKVHAALKERYKETNRAAKRFRDSLAPWTRYADSLEAKIKALEKRLERCKNANHSAQALSTPGVTPRSRPVSAAIHHPLSGQTALGSSFPSEEGADAAVGPHIDAAGGGLYHTRGTPSPGTPVPVSAERSADEETDDGSDVTSHLPTLPPGIATEPTVKIKEEPSSDVPIIVSERTLRKRKTADGNMEMPSPPRKIKREHSASSDPVVTGEAVVFSPHESIDLDEREQGMPTPKKQRPSGPVHLQQGGLMATLENDALRELQDAGTLDGEGTPSHSPARCFIHPSAISISELQLSKKNEDRNPPTRAMWTLDRGVADVAEETFESFHSPRPRRARAGVGPTPRSPAQSRLLSLLNHSSPAQPAAYLPPYGTRRGVTGRIIYREGSENLPPPQQPEPGRKSPSKATLAAEGSPAVVQGRQAQGKANVPRPSRLRDRPVTELRSEDFRVNPRFTGGYNHAFDEVVRSREEREELAGCTDPNCCGRQFRAMAESELSAGGPGVLSRIADTKMMEKYLGNEAYRLVDMTREERREVWLKAKIRDLADKYGRHRHRFARRPSPPGYWNPDFPSTQEIEKSKEESEKMERRLVEERWREAMRGGGRWLFRDE